MRHFATLKKWLVKKMLFSSAGDDWGAWWTLVFDAHVNVVIPEGWLRLIHPAINLLLMVRVLSFPPHCPQQSRENHSINCLAVAGAAWQGGVLPFCAKLGI